MDNKAPDAFRTISEVAELLDTPPHVLRFWESRFTQLRPVKRTGGRRYYRPGDTALLAGIRKLLREDGMTIRGVQKLLRERGVKYVAGLAPLPEPLADAVDAPPQLSESPHAAPAGTPAHGDADTFDALDTGAAPPEAGAHGDPGAPDPPTAPADTVAARLRRMPAPAAEQAAQMRTIRARLAALREQVAARTQAPH